MEIRLSTYGFPSRNPNPFDLVFPGNFFALAQQYSNLAKSLSDFGPGVFERFIPMGRTTIIVCQRKAIIKDGTLIKTWEEPLPTTEFKDSYTGKFMVSTDRSINKTNEVYTLVFNDLIEAENQAVQISMHHKASVLVSTILYSIMWH